MAGLFGNVSAAGGFDQAEIDFVTQLINSGQTTIDEVSSTFGVPRDVVASVYAQNAPAAVEPSTTEQAIGLFQDIQKANTLANAAKDIYSGLTTTAPAAAANVPYQSPYAINLGGSDAAVVADPTATFTGGLSSVVGALSGQESKAETAALTVLSAFNPAAALAYRLFDALDLFGGGGLKETPMTPEEAAKYAGESRLATTLQGAGEGAGELILDAIQQAEAAGVAPEKIAETLNTRGDLASELIGLTVGSNQMLSEADLAAAQEAEASSTAKTAAEEALSNVSAEGGFSEAEANEVYDLIKSNTVSVNDVSTVFNVPEGIINAALETIDAQRAAEAATDPLEGSTSSLESDGDLEGNLDTIFDSTASASATAGTDATVVNTDTEHPWLYEGNGVLRNVFTGEVQTNESGTENLVVGETYSSGTPTEATTRSDDTADSGNINVILTPSITGGTTSTVINAPATGPADTAVVDAGGGVGDGVVTITNGNGVETTTGTATPKSTDPTLTVGTPTVTPAVTPTPTVINGVDGVDGVAGVDGVDGVDGRDGKDGRDGRDGLTGLLTLNSIATPIADEIFTSEFKMDYLKPEFIGLLDLTRGRTV